MTLNRTGTAETDDFGTETGSNRDRCEPGSVSPHRIGTAVNRIWRDPNRTETTVNRNCCEPKPLQIGEPYPPWHSFLSTTTLHHLYTTLYHLIPPAYHLIPPYTTLYHLFNTLYHLIRPYTIFIPPLYQLTPPYTTCEPELF